MGMLPSLSFRAPGTTAGLQSGHCDPTKEEQRARSHPAELRPLSKLHQILFTIQLAHLFASYARFSVGSGKDAQTVHDMSWRGPVETPPDQLGGGAAPAHGPFLRKLIHIL